MELTEHNKLTTYARKLLGDRVKAVSVVSCTDPRSRGYALMLVYTSGLLHSYHIGPAAGAQSAIKRIVAARYLGWTS